MPIVVSPVLSARNNAIGGDFSARSLPLERSGIRNSPVLVVDDFRVSGQPFGPHPHAGFAAVTYVFEDSKADLRSRDSLGNDVVVGPGGIVWTQAGSGVLHEELPAPMGRELHGLQVFVNVRSNNKLAAPRVLKLESPEVPEWRHKSDRVRVVVGTYADVSSPLVPDEPFDLFEVEIARTLSLSLKPAHTAVVYVREGEAIVVVGAREQKLAEGRAVILHGGDGEFVLRTDRFARIVVLAGANIDEPVYAHGPFIMNDRLQVDAAIARYRSGAMGHLAPAYMT